MRRNVFDVLEELAVSIREGDSPVAYAMLALGFTVGCALHVGVSAATIAGLLSKERAKVEPP